MRRVYLVCLDKLCSQPHSCPDRRTIIKQWQDYSIGEHLTSWLGKNLTRLAQDRLDEILLLIYSMWSFQDKVLFRTPRYLNLLTISKRVLLISITRSSASAVL